jgi:hypothetical protein
MTTLAASALELVGGVPTVAVNRTRPAWEGSTRRSRLPPNWPELRAEAHRRNPKHICHWCSGPAGSDLDHKQRGDHLCQAPNRHRQPCQCNLDWIHNRDDFVAGRSRKNCHGEKTGAEGAAARQRLNRPEEIHPALR